MPQQLGKLHFARWNVNAMMSIALSNKEMQLLHPVTEIWQPEVSKLFF